MSHVSCRPTVLRAIASPAAILVLATCCSSDLLRADEKPADEKAASVWMKKKLEYSQQILGGLALADFDQIQDAAEHLQSLNKIEAFIRARTPAYRHQLQIFQDSNEEILRQASARNLEGITLAFTQMTFSCVNCHKQLRVP